MSNVWPPIKYIQPQANSFNSNDNYLLNYIYINSDIDINIALNGYCCNNNKD